MGGCGVIGDCIALGVAAALAILFPHHRCDVTARMGWPPATIAQHVPSRSYAWAVISAGSNPGGHTSTAQRQAMWQQLRAIRAQVHAARVFWIVPAAPARAALVHLAALEHGDEVVPVGRTVRDRVHPDSYFRVARAVVEKLP